VEQDLIISAALVKIFTDSSLKNFLKKIVTLSFVVSIVGNRT